MKLDLCLVDCNSGYIYKACAYVASYGGTAIYPYPYLHTYIASNRLVLSETDAQEQQAPVRRAVTTSGYLTNLYII